ncbi:type II toxin-antitoxin system HigB family toxin [Testudinibacter sp. TR-2022]|uniref:type II toxin-antitoxin system HigB family toxin n=1 Tax=Testudinibacter sp. TR-2022 TaxID=2585029 RepID=UPI001119A36A|nr:type II toxin-antitoxin system HigB family toxin [Testudinibacter sp. TR-2022]TNG91299.1 type II toxin-antitoxin system HigB family toxin [Pasteurellaceae bacterium USgator41]TNG96508.1 type II toxin-antitoxin system HigB family toxin [Pasteurellaceae bacterium UScroc31]TNG97108.1 type II toxin-antitoxin system HigB family toxin [Pasteurellaceae bacterium UScroc12]TNH01555.1 type II toxin-antitoxin system HigB family toxin [Pasteurellaceae bacterium USgator11]TNH07476.1 type II toxin-antito
MRIITVGTLKNFWMQYPDAEQPIKSWIAAVKKLTWNSPNDIKAKFRSASILKNNRVVFNIKGNDYRLIVKIIYMRKVIYVKFVGTHAQYDVIDANTVELF